MAGSWTLRPAAKADLCQLERDSFSQELRLTWFFAAELHFMLTGLDQSGGRGYFC